MGRTSSKAGGGGGSFSKADRDQIEEAIKTAKVKGASKVQYTDSQGNETIFQIKDGGGVFRTSYSQEVEDLTRLSEKQLSDMLAKQTAVVNANYQRFTRQAASRSGSLVQGFVNVGAKVSDIKKALFIKRKNRKDVKKIWDKVTVVKS